MEESSINELQEKVRIVRILSVITHFPRTLFWLCTGMSINTKTIFDKDTGTCNLMNTFI